MGYINLAAASVDQVFQAIISFWFRAPKASLDTVTAQESTAEQDPPFLNILPLVVMGQKGISQNPTQKATDVYRTTHWGGFDWAVPYPRTVVTGGGGDPFPPYTYRDVEYHYDATPYETTTTAYVGTYFTVTQGPENPVEPTYIGVDCSQDPPTLVISLESGRKATVTGASHKTLTGIDPGVEYQGNSTLVGVDKYKFHYAFGIFQYGELIEKGTTVVDVAGGSNAVSIPPKYTYTDTSDLSYQSTQHFTADTTAEVTADTWQHVLVSFEIRPCITHGAGSGGFVPPLASYVDSAPSIWVAVDDVNYDGDDLSSDGLGDGGDPNWVLTDDAYSIAGSFSGDGPPEQFNLPIEDLPIDGEAMGMPATAEFVDNIFDVDMAEFQMWIGQTLDTNDQDMRRLFIDENGKPVKPSVAADQLGRPAILIHRAGNWKTGKNTGTTGIDDKGKIIDSGQFEPSGTIISFKPEPQYTGAPVEALNPKSEG